MGQVSVQVQSAETGNRLWGERDCREEASLDKMVAIAQCSVLDREREVHREGEITGSLEDTPKGTHYTIKS